jgi:hypothetical protein
MKTTLVEWLVRLILCTTIIVQAVQLLRISDRLEAAAGQLNRCEVFSE